MGRRRLAREMALQALYMIDTGGTPEKAAFASVASGDEADEKTLYFARDLVRGVRANLADIDRRIEETAVNWRLARMAAVDRNVLRVAAYELLLRCDTPVKVAIDEAIEIVRKYSTEESTRFVNGILDKIKDSRPSPHDPEERPR